MEALTAASVAALTIYDMVKGVEKGVEIRSIRLVSKTGGKSGDWHRSAGAPDAASAPRTPRQDAGRRPRGVELRAGRPAGDRRRPAHRWSSRRATGAQPGSARQLRRPLAARLEELGYQVERGVVPDEVGRSARLWSTAPAATGSLSPRAARA